MSVYKPTRLRLWSLGALLARFAAYVLGHAPMLLVVGALFAPSSPHLLLKAKPDGRVPEKTTCLYLGVWGTRRLARVDTCPVIRLLDVGQQQRAVRRQFVSAYSVSGAAPKS